MNDLSKDFILEIGKDFTFVGEEYRVMVGNRDYYIDLLFYHRELACLVALELKIGAFKPEHLGKMNFYLEALEFTLSRSWSPTLISEYTLKLIDKNLLRQKLHELTGMADLNMIDSECYDD